MEPKTFLVVLLVFSLLDDSPAWVLLFTASCLVVGWSFGPVYRKVLARRDRHS